MLVLRSLSIRMHVFRFIFLLLLFCLVFVRYSANKELWGCLNSRTSSMTPQCDCCCVFNPSVCLSITCQQIYPWKFPMQLAAVLSPDDARCARLRAATSPGEAESLLTLFVVVFILQLILTLAGMLNVMTETVGRFPCQSQNNFFAYEIFFVVFDNENCAFDKRFRQ